MKLPQSKSSVSLTLERISNLVEEFRTKKDEDNKDKEKNKQELKRIDDELDAIRLTLADHEARITALGG